jgi:hypothetical protein
MTDQHSSPRRIADDDRPNLGLWRLRAIVLDVVPKRLKLGQVRPQALGVVGRQRGADARQALLYLAHVYCVATLSHDDDRAVFASLELSAGADQHAVALGRRPTA